MPSPSPDPIRVRSGPSPEEAEAVERDSVGAGAAAALHLLLGLDGPPPGPGDELAPLGHWLAFLPRTAPADLGPDGHPRHGALVAPPPDLPRRMFAGGRLMFGPPVRVGAELVRSSRVLSVTDKAGRSGPLRFVTVKHVVHQGAPAVVAEEQDLVYRPAVPAPAGRPAPVLPGEGPGPGWEHRRSLPTDEALLFRFSALTYNAHRIHYDLPYATAVEGYPGLVVQGPLQAMALAALARDVLAQDGRTGGGLGSFAFRALAPAFCGTTLELVARPGGLGLELAAYDGQGRRTMEAAAEPPAAAFHADQEDAR